MSASITIDVSEAVKKLDPAQMEDAIAAALHGAGEILQQDIKQYAMPELPTYRRTGKLGGAWAPPTVDRKKMQAIIGNNMAYAPYVQDADQQAWMHRGRWASHTTQYVAKKRAEDVKRFIEQALARWAR